MPVYLELFHGTETTDRSKLDGWGEQGPILGPLAYVHTTYSGDVRCCPLDPDGKPNEFASADLQVAVECLLFYDGMYYGDWSVTDGAWAMRSKAERGRMRQVEAGRCCAEAWSRMSVERDEVGLLEP